MPNSTLPEGQIRLGSDAANALGFTKDKFTGYLWHDGNAIYISLIESLDQGKGHLKALFDRIFELGYAVKVPTPLPLMEAILKHEGFVHTMEFDPLVGDNCDVWCKASEAAVPI